MAEVTAEATEGVVTAEVEEGEDGTAVEVAVDGTAGAVEAAGMIEGAGGTTEGVGGTGVAVGGTTKAGVGGTARAAPVRAALCPRPHPENFTRATTAVTMVTVGTEVRLNRTTGTRTTDRCPGGRVDLSFLN